MADKLKKKTIVVIPVQIYENVITMTKYQLKNLIFNHYKMFDNKSLHLTIELDNK